MMEGEERPELADDLLRGADEIAAFMFGKKGTRRKIYYLYKYTRIPLFRIGSSLCARRSVLLGWIRGQEKKLTGERLATTEEGVE